MSINLAKTMNTNSLEEALHLSSLYHDEKKIGMSHRDFLKYTAKLLNYEARFSVSFKPTPEQLRSLITQADRVLVDACPGAGKTASMIFRLLIDRHLYNYSQDDQIIMTYTNKAAFEMEDRCNKIARRHNFLIYSNMSTIHSFAKSVETIGTSLNVLDDRGAEVVIKRTKVKEQAPKNLNPRMAKLMASIEKEEEYIEITKWVTERDIHIEVLKELGLSRTFYPYIQNLPRWLNMIIESGIETEEDLRSLEIFNEMPEVTLKDILRINELSKNKRIAYGLMNFTDMLEGLYLRLKDLESIEDAPFNEMKILLRKRHIYIDEFQDISKLQWNIIQELLRLNPDCKLYCVGDSDQSIYSFRGSSPKYLNQFEEILNQIPSERDKTVDIILYTENKRSNRNIVKMTSNFIQTNEDRYNKIMQCSHKDEGEINIIRNGSEDYIDYIVNYMKNYLKNGYNHSVAILYRDHKNSSKIARAMLKENIPIIAKGDIGYSSSETKDILGILKMLLNPNDPDLTREYLYKILTSVNKEKALSISKLMLNKDKPFSTYINPIGRVSRELESLRFVYAKVREGKMYKALSILIEMYSKAYLNLFPMRMWKIDDMLDMFSEYTNITYDKFVDTIEREEIKQSNFVYYPNAVDLLTFHSAKGLEYDTVFILPISNEVTPKEKMLLRLPQDKRQNYIEEERRLLYVAMTRAKKELIVFIDNIQDHFPSEIRTSYFKLLQDKREEGMEWEKT